MGLCVALTNDFTNRLLSTRPMIGSTSERIPTCNVTSPLAREIVIWTGMFFIELAPRGGTLCLCILIMLIYDMLCIKCRHFCSLIQSPVIWTATARRDCSAWIAEGSRKCPGVLVQAERAPIIATSLEKVVVSALGGVDGVAGAS